MKIAILAHEQFPARAKTATGVMRYGDDEVVALIDRSRSGTTVQDHTPWLPDAPIVASMADIDPPDALVIGIAPVGGRFDESWRSDVRLALEKGCDVISGLHAYLAEDEEFARIANSTGATIRDVRRPSPDLDVARGVADQVDATVIQTVGTDCSSGKLTTTWELLEGMVEQGYEVGAIPTGQTGIIVEGWGEPVDAVIADYIAGAVEKMICERASEYDILVVEGQGSIVHPAYSGVTVGMLHGAMPDALILCHEAGRERISGFDRTPIPPLDECISLYEEIAHPVCDTSVVGLSVNTSSVPSDAAARDHLASLESDLALPATDVVRMDAEPLIEALPIS